MWWRVPHTGKMWAQAKGEPNHAAFRELVLSGRVRGVMAFDGDLPVGWCSFGPRADFPRVEMEGAYRRDDARSAWCVNCFFISPDYRGKDLSRSLLRAALDAMHKFGVAMVEAYPVVEALDGKPLPAALAWTGLLSIFLEQGFTEIQRLSRDKPLVRLNLVEYRRKLISMEEDRNKHVRK